MALENVREWLYGCTRCGTCKSFSNIFEPGCPAGERYKLESYYASGKQLIARALAEGKLSLSDDEMRERIYACTGCLVCQQICGVFHHEHIFDIVQSVRTEAISNGFFHPAYAMIYYGLRSEDNVFRKPRNERGEWARDLDVKKATRQKVDVLYHAGCLFSYEQELWHVPRNIVSILQNAGVDVGIMGEEEACCGGKAYEIGYSGEFAKYARHTVENASALGIKTIVLSCSDGYSTMKNLYPKINIVPQFEVLHSIEFIYQLIQTGQIKLKREVPLKVTYHDPCHLGRHLDPGLYDPPREILKSIPGIELIEMERNREKSWCCGAGSGVKQANPELSLWAANERLQEAQATGASALVTACGWCERNFLDAVREYSVNLKIYDIADLVRLAISP